MKIKVKKKAGVVALITDKMGFKIKAIARNTFHNDKGINLTLGICYVRYLRHFPQMKFSNYTYSDVIIRDKNITQMQNGLDSTQQGQNSKIKTNHICNPLIY